MVCCPTIMDEMDLAGGEEGEGSVALVVEGEACLFPPGRPARKAAETETLKERASGERGGSDSDGAAADPGLGSKLQRGLESELELLLGPEIESGWELELELGLGLELELNLELGLGPRLGLRLGLGLGLELVLAGLSVLRLMLA